VRHGPPIAETTRAPVAQAREGVDLFALEHHRGRISTEALAR
jgi:hypothetical protein